MSHTHSVKDNDKKFTINPDTRAVRSLTRTVVAWMDHNSEHLTFEIPRYVEAHDITLCNSVEIHYRNYGDDGEKLGLYTVTDLEVAPDDEDKVTFTWLISQNATSIVGRIAFVIRFQCLQGEEILYSWSTMTCESIIVSESLHNTEKIVEQYADVLERWKIEIGSGAFFPEVSNKITAPETASVGQTIVVKAVDENGKPTEWEAVDSQPRTHWTDVQEERKTLLPLCTMAATVEGDRKVVYITTPVEGVPAGSVCEVNWNGVVYTTVVREIRPEDSPLTALVAGNLGAFDDSFEDTGEPFTLIWIPDIEGIYMAVLVADDSTEVTLSIEAIVSHKTIHKLPSEYLDLQWTSTAKEVECIKDIAVPAYDGYTTWVEDFSERIDSLGNGCTIIVYVDSVRYPVVMTGAMSGKLLDGYSGDIPEVGLHIITMGSAIALSNASGIPHTVTICMLEDHSTIPIGHIPENAFLKGIPAGSEIIAGLTNLVSIGNYNPKTQQVEYTQVIPLLRDSYDREQVGDHWETVVSASYVDLALAPLVKRIEELEAKM